MQHAVGAPLPPPHQTGARTGRRLVAPGRSDTRAPPHPGPAAGTRRGSGATRPRPAGLPRTAERPRPRPRRARLRGLPPPARPSSTAGPRTAAPQPPPRRRRPDTTGHVQLPPGRPRRACRRPPPPSPAPAAATLAVLLIGPAGAGKTTVARYWADRRRVPTAHISLDDVREWVCSGFADPQAGWNDHSEAQYRLARRTCGFAARNFLANGISCILDDAVFPDRPVVGLGGWKRHVGPGLLPVVLLPGLEIVLERNAERTGNRRLSDEEVARIHGRMAGWYGSGLPIIDNSHLDVDGHGPRSWTTSSPASIASPPAW